MSTFHQLLDSLNLLRHPDSSSLQENLVVTGEVYVTVEVHIELIGTMLTEHTAFFMVSVLMRERHRRQQWRAAGVASA
jgi:hypothetical protein